MSKTRKPVLGGREKVKVAIAQISPVYLDRDASLERAVSAIGEAARNVYKDAQEMLGRIVSERWLTARAVLGRLLFDAPRGGGTIK